MLCTGRGAHYKGILRATRSVNSGAIPYPEVVAVVDRSYARDLDHWLGTVRRLSDLPEDPTLCVQIRAKSLPASELEQAANLARELFVNRSVSLSWNGDHRIATAYGFDACHQPQEDISEFTKEASHLVHSASIHDEASLRQAQSCDVDFVVFGPVFQPHWKQVQAQGINELTRLTALAKVPVVAIGGVNLDTVTSIARTGACGVACLSGVMDAPEPVEFVIRLQERWRECRRSG